MGEKWAKKKICRTDEEKWETQDFIWRDFISVILFMYVFLKISFAHSTVSQTLVAHVHIIPPVYFSMTSRSNKWKERRTHKWKIISHEKRFRVRHKREWIRIAGRSVEDRAEQHRRQRLCLQNKNRIDRHAFKSLSRFYFLRSFLFVFVERNSPATHISLRASTTRRIHVTDPRDKKICEMESSSCTIQHTYVRRRRLASGMCLRVGKLSMCVWNVDICVHNAPFEVRTNGATRVRTFENVAACSCVCVCVLANERRQQAKRINSANKIYFLQQSLFISRIPFHSAATNAVQIAIVHIPIQLRLGVSTIRQKYDIIAIVYPTYMQHVRPSSRLHRARQICVCMQFYRYYYYSRHGWAVLFPKAFGRNAQHAETHKWFQ